MFVPNINRNYYKKWFHLKKMNKEGGGSGRLDTKDESKGNECKNSF